MAEAGSTTVVIISYNCARFLPEAVRSVVEQTARPRVMLVDDRSTDHTREVAAELLRAHPWIDMHLLQNNIGLARVRNLAAALASTPWIMYLDSDDWLDRHYVARAEAVLSQQPHLDVLTTDMTIVRDGQRRRVVRARVPRYWNDLLARNTIVQTSLIRRALVQRLGGYDPELDFEDWDFWIRVLQAGGRIGRLPAPHLFWRQHGANNSRRCDERAAAAAVRRKHAAVT